jgi:hypothetical protein
MADLNLRAVLFQEEGWWVAQCLEYALAAQARTQADVVYEIERLLVGRILIGAEKGCLPFAGLPPAPRRFWKMFELAEPLAPEVAPLREGAFEVLPDIKLRAA